MFYKKKIFVGNGINSNPQIEKFLGIIIVGYFIIKIVYPIFFNYYPDKYYFKNIQINTSEKIDSETETNTENITLNAYAPGMWNNEISDFITLIVLSYIIFVFTHFSNKSCIDSNGNIDLIFLIGYIIGLGFPILKIIFSQICSHQLPSRYYLFVFIFIIYIVVVNYLSITTNTESMNNKNEKMNYLIFVIAISLILSGLIYARKKSNNHSIVKYFYNDGESCAFKKTNNTTTGILQSSGDNLNITYPFIVFIILLLFSYEPSGSINKNVYIFIYGLLLGILVSYVSYFGFQYFLEKKPLQQCNNMRECRLKEIGSQDYSNILGEEDIENIKENIYLDINLNNSSTKYLNETLGKYSGFKLLIMIAIIIVIIYLIYFYLKK